MPRSQRPATTPDIDQIDRSEPRTDEARGHHQPFGPSPARPMNLDDETFLSAYLDDELDPADRMAAAWAIETSPRLAHELRSLAASRHVVAGLGRPAAPIDLAPAIVVRLTAPRRTSRPRVGSRLASAAMAGGLVSLAASLLASVVFLHHATHDPVRPDPASSGPEVATQPALAVVEGPTESASTPPLLARLEHPRPAVVAVPPPVATVADPLVVAQEQADRERIAGMLERPDVHRILIVTDVIDAGDRIKAMLQQDVRRFPDFGRISVAQGIVIDPRHPDAADVFTLVLDGREAEPLVGKLARAFPKTNLVVEPKPDPALLTQLPEVGHALILPGLTPDSPALPRVVAMNDNPTIRDRGAGVSSMGEIDPFAGIDGDPPRGAPTRIPAGDGPTTFLVWVTRPTPRH